MKQQFSNMGKTIKEFWSKLSKKVKGIIVVVGVITLGLAIGLTIYFNAATKGYVVLYPDITKEEASEVFALLQTQEIVPEINAKGQVMVPEAVWADTMVNLAAQGYPKAAPPYGLYFDNIGFTTTESEKQQTLRFQIQDRMQEMLGRITGIKSAIVNIDTPKETNYVWEEEKQTASASVLLEFEKGMEFSDDQIAGVKNLVTKSVSKLSPENVSVVDSATGLELGNEQDPAKSYNFKRLEFEKEIQAGIEDQATRILEGRYGKAGVTAVAAIKLNYDKIETEQKDLLPLDENGNPIVKKKDEAYTTSGEKKAVGDIVGEENNTDSPPTYNATDPNASDGVGGVTDYQRNYDFDYGYVMTQIKQGEPILKEASIAIVVDDEEFTSDTADTIVNLVSKATSIDTDSIEVTNLNYTVPVDDTVATPEPVVAKDRTMILIIAASALGIIILISAIVFVILFFRKKSKQKHIEEEQKAEETIKTLQQEIDEHKQALRSAAEASNSKENAIADEVRSFAKENPEITASLIRSMLKEDE